MVQPRRSERILMRRSIVVSGAAHMALLLAVLLGLPIPVPTEPPPPPTIEMEFTSSDSGGTPHKAKKPAPKPAPAPAPVPQEAPPAPTPPVQAPTEEPPPPPPPPPPMPPPPETPPVELPDTQVPPKVEEPSPDAVQAPPTPPAPPVPSRAASPPTPQPEPNALPKMQQFSHVTQPNETKKAVPDTHSLLATLDAFRADQKQTHPPKARANPLQGGAPNGGGAPDGDITSALNAADQRAIGNAVRRCYTEDTAARDYATFVAHLVVTVDATGMARIVQFAPETQARMDADSSYRALAERARAAVLSPTCAQLPLPKAMLGQTRQLKFVFRP
ncbi:energy transducer TonB [Gluconacetobacter diazotrophicus]|uniref:Energy transducer TonB n=1 Tax=Gluconacetobacter diazotrophicus TaxID=33996 RepID=A0A7W4I5L6_GLUDI|nr:energy transducer TonB [Gluconacetobacter diazotrophicus]MBB2156694.1 energy transducer TonB [Gluconacetobacter diazotrophicus]